MRGQSFAEEGKEIKLVAFDPPHFRPPEFVHYSYLYIEHTPTHSHTVSASQPASPVHRQDNLLFGGSSNLHPGV